MLSRSCIKVVIGINVNMILFHRFSGLVLVLFMVLFDGGICNRHLLAHTDFTCPSSSNHVMFKVEGVNTDEFIVYQSSDGTLLGSNGVDSHSKTVTETCIHMFLGHYMNEGHWEVCDVGQTTQAFHQGEADECKLCPERQWDFLGSNWFAFTLGCGAQYYEDGTSGSEKHCNPFYSGGDVFSCTLDTKDCAECPEGMILSDTTTEGIPVYDDDNFCAPVGRTYPSGHYFNDCFTCDSSGCTKASDCNSREPTPCELGKRCPYISGTVENNFILPRPTKWQSVPCAACPVGKTRAAHENSCSNCPAHHVSVTEPNPDVNNQSYTHCVLCPGDHVTANRITNECECDLNYYGDGVVCTACPNEKVTIGTGATSEADCDCASGQCKANEQGQCDANGDFCASCPLKTFFDESTGTCETCSAGKYGVAVNDVNICQDCPNGKYQPSTVGQTHCELCPTGKIGISSVSIREFQQDSCQKCEGNTYSGTAGLTVCSLCTDGLQVIQNLVDGNTGCEQCDPGTYSTGGEPCEQCEPYEYNNAPAQSSCTPCSEMGGGTSAGNAGTTCLACVPGKKVAGDGTCVDCDFGKITTDSAQSECVDCVAGKYQDNLGQSFCKDCDACPDQHYRFMCSGASTGTCEECEECESEDGVEYIRVRCMNRKGHAVTALDDTAAGRCVRHDLVSRTPFCAEEPDGSVDGSVTSLGLGGFSFRELFGLNSNEVGFQCRRSCDSSTRLDRLNNQHAFTWDGFSPTDNDEGVDTGYCDGPFACNVMACTMQGDTEEYQESTRVPYACPVDLDQELYLLPEKNESLVRNRRSVSCQTCQECGSDAPAEGSLSALNWGRGCAKECSQLICVNDQIFDWTDKTCKDCTDLRDLRLCSTDDRAAMNLNGRDISGNRPKYFFENCQPKLVDEDMKSITYGDCRTCLDQNDVMCPDGEYHAECGTECAACRPHGQSVPYTTTYRNLSGNDVPLYCQVRACEARAGRERTGVMNMGALCHRDCVRVECEAGEYHLGCVLPHDERCVPAFPPAHDTMTLRTHSPVHTNVLEPVNDRHHFSSFENVLLNVDANNDDLHQCVWNARDIRDNDMNPGGISHTFFPPAATYAEEITGTGSKACHEWNAYSGFDYPMLPLQNTVSHDVEVNSTRRVLVNTSTRVLRYMEGDSTGFRGYDGQDVKEAVRRPFQRLGVYVGDFFLNMDLTHTHESHLAVPVPNDRNLDEAVRWVPQWQVSAALKQTSPVESTVTAQLEMTGADINDIDLALLSPDDRFVVSGDSTAYFSMKGFDAHEQSHKSQGIDKVMDGVELFGHHRLFVTEHATQPVYVIQKVTEDTQAKTKFQTNYFLQYYYPSLFFGSRKKNVPEAQDAVTTDTLHVDKLNALVTVRVNADGLAEAPGVDLTSKIDVACYAQYTNRYHIMCMQKHKVDAQSGLSTKLQHTLAPVLQYDVTTCSFLPDLITVTNAAGNVATVTDLVPWKNNDFVLIIREHGSRVSRLFYVASTPEWKNNNQELTFTNDPFPMDSFTMNDVLKIAHHPHYFADTAISSNFHNHLYTVELTYADDEFAFDLGVYTVGYDSKVSDFTSSTVNVPRLYDLFQKITIFESGLVEGAYRVQPTTWPSSTVVLEVSHTSSMLALLVLPRVLEDGAERVELIVRFYRVEVDARRVLCSAEVEAPAVFQEALMFTDTSHLVESYISRAWVDDTVVSIGFMGQMFDVRCAGASVSVSELDDGFLKGSHYVSLYNGFLTFNAVDVGAVVRTRSTSPCLYGFMQSQRASVINTHNVRRTLLSVSRHRCARECGLDQDCQVYYWHFDKRVGSLKNPCYLFDRELLKSWSTTFKSTLDADASTRQYLSGFTCNKIVDNAVLSNDHVVPVFKTMEMRALIEHATALGNSTYHDPSAQRFMTRTKKLVDSTLGTQVWTTSASDPVAGFYAFATHTGSGSPTTIKWTPITSAVVDGQRFGLTQECVNQVSGTCRQYHSLQDDAAMMRYDRAGVLESIRLFDTLIDINGNTLVNDIILGINGLNLNTLNTYRQSSTYSNIYVTAIFELECNAQVQISKVVVVRPQLYCSNFFRVVAVLKIPAATSITASTVADLNVYDQFEGGIRVRTKPSVSIFYSVSDPLYELDRGSRLVGLQLDSTQLSRGQVHAMVTDTNVRVKSEITTVSSSWSWMRKNVHATTLGHSSFLRFKLKRNLSEGVSPKLLQSQATSLALDAVSVLPVLTLPFCGVLCESGTATASTTTARRLLQSQDYLLPCGGTTAVDTTPTDVVVGLATSITRTVVTIAENKQIWFDSGLMEWILGADGQSCSEVCGSVLPGGTGSTGADYPSGLGYVGVTNSVEYPRYQCLPSFLYLNREFTRSFIATTTGVTCSNYNTRLCDNNAVCEDTSPMFQPASQRCYYMSASTYSNCDAKRNGIQRLCPCGRPLTCSENAYYDTTSGTCEQCPSGKFSSVGVVSLSGCGCSVGEEMSSDGVTCRPCDPGTYQDQAGQAVCKFCETGKYSPNTGSTQSSECVEVTSCAPGNKRLGTFESGFYCVACGLGKYTSVYDQSSCTLCDSGKIQYETGKSFCYDCVEGTYQAPAQDYCVDCPASKTSPALSVSIDDCICKDMFETDSNGNCVCPLSNQTRFDTLCLDRLPFENGDFFIDLQIKYAGGGPYYYHLEVDHWDAATDLLWVNFWQEGVKTGGSIGYSAQILLNNLNRFVCIPGHVKNADPWGPNGWCSICPAGTYSMTVGQTSCTACAAGKYSTLVGSPHVNYCLSCSSCDDQTMPGWTTNCGGSSAGSCSYCTDCSGYGGTTNNVGCDPATQTAGTCEPCPAGQYAGHHESLTACTNCVAGKYSTSSANSCTQCSNGQASDVVGRSTVCPDCEAGKFSFGHGNTVCTLCPPGKFRAYTGAHGCEACIQGHYASSSGSTTCLACGSNQYSSSPTGSNLEGTSCVDCPAGKTCGDAYGCWQESQCY